MDEIEEFFYSEDRDERVKETAEVFTPVDRVRKMLELFNIDWDDPPQDKTFLDPTCGSGNFLVELAKLGIPLHNLYGVDLMPDNIETCKRRLREIFFESMDRDEIDFHLDRNIVQADATTYHYQFWWYQDPKKIADCIF